MSIDDEDPHCPECGEPIGQTATYCMHCSADLTDEREASDGDDDGLWDESDSESEGGSLFGAEDGSLFGDSTEQTRTETPTPTDSATPDAGETGDDQLLDPDGLVDNTLTVLVGIAGGIVVGLVGTIALFMLTTSAWALLFGFVGWLGSTAYLVRRRTVQEAVAKSGYAVAIVLMLVPLGTLSPAMSVEGGISSRLASFVTFVLVMVVPAGFSAAIGWAAAQFVPDGSGSSEG